MPTKPNNLPDLPIREIIARELFLNQNIIQIAGTIDDDLAAHVLNLTNYIRQTTSKPATFLMDSGGGVVYAALSIFDAIQQLNKTHETVGIVTGICMSATVPILQACKDRAAYPNATFMMHEVSSGAIGTVSANTAQHAEAVRLQKRMKEIVRDRAGKLPTLKNGVNKYFTAEDALKYGLIDRIVS